jgi:16S rRNA A1518/A1519 N6-dimethyltransferase RsmA/KsgA/DIM1 with predicted DNA glycosylase/AP lyase activity
MVITFVWTSFFGAPWVPTSMKMVHKMLAMAEVGPDDLVYDLGCGDGRMIVTAARRYGSRAVGIEIDPLRYLWCQILISVFGLRDRVKIVYGNFFKQDLSEADVVTCYLIQSTNIKLEKKLKQELRPGTRVVSNRFSFPGLYKVRQDGEAKLYLCNFTN